jgi:hypothetical protein
LVAGVLRVRLEQAVQRERPVVAAPASAVVAAQPGPPEGVAVQHGQLVVAVMPDARPVVTATVPHGRLDEGVAAVEK